MWTERDGEIVEWIGRSRSYERLQALVADGLLEQKTLLHRQPGLYIATRRGLRWHGLQRLGHRLSPAGFEHARQVATTAVQLHKGLAEWRLTGERELRRENLDHNHHRPAESRAGPTNTAFERLVETGGREVESTRGPSLTAGLEGSEGRIAASASSALEGRAGISGGSARVRVAHCATSDGRLDDADDRARLGNTGQRHVRDRGARSEHLWRADVV